jgi:hypothetical protein
MTLNFGCCVWANAAVAQSSRNVATTGRYDFCSRMFKQSNRIVLAGIDCLVFRIFSAKNFFGGETQES